MIHACQKALDAKDAAILTRDKELSQFQILTKKQADEIAEKDRSLRAWYRSPYLWVVVGLAVGVYVGKK